MAESLLSVRSTRARELAHRSARHERQTIANVVERALAAYVADLMDHAPASEFYPSLSQYYGTDIGLEHVIDEHRSPHESAGT